MQTERVLHIVQHLETGAVENWLVRMFCYAVSRGISPDWTFYCTLGKEGRLDKQARELGAKVIYSPVALSNKLLFLHALRKELERSRYDVIHCHHDLMSAPYLLASLGLPVKKRIVHVHNADETIPTPNRMKAALLRPLFRAICLARADCIVGISNHTLDTFLAGRRRRPGRDLVHYYGIDSAPYENARFDRTRFRRDLGLPEDARIVLFLGRIVPEKNPLFALEVIAEMCRRDLRVFGVFVGSGSLDDDVRERANHLDVAHAIRCLGWRNDVVEVMSCCDWFILPHPENPLEGFGIAVVEAQLSCLRLLLSGVPDDPLLPTANARRMSLGQSPVKWAEKALDMLTHPAATREETLVAFRQSPMAMDRALQGLLHLYGVDGRSN